MDLKKCPSCGGEKDLTEFYETKSTKSGYSIYCKDCFRERSRKTRQSYIDSALNTENKESTKRCRKCGEIKLLVEFSKQKGTKDGLYGYCKQCKSSEDKKYREDNNDSINQRRKEAYQTNIDTKRSQSKASYQRNKENILVYQKEYREKIKIRYQ